MFDGVFKTYDSVDNTSSYICKWKCLVKYKTGNWFYPSNAFLSYAYGFFLHVSQDIRLITNRSVITFFVNNMQNINGGNTVYLQEK